jgi:D-amino-acid dehydrogenase
LRKQLIAGGVIFRNEAAISGFEVKKGCVTGLISENGKNYPVDHVVLSGGAWSGKLMRSLGVHMPVQPAKGYSITMPKPAGAPDLPVILSEAKVVLTPMGDELRIGGTLEMSNFNENIKIRRVEAILKAVPQYFPKIRPKMPLAENIWYGFRPCSPDGLPYIGRVLKFENLTIAAGHAMLGISLGPATGRLIADLIANKKSNLQLELFNPERF